MKERSHGPFTDIFDFATRACGESVNKRTVESLIKAGALDGLGHNRAELLSVYEQLMDDAAQKKRQNLTGQLSLFDSAATGAAARRRPSGSPPYRSIPGKVLLSMEKEMTGVYITGHPLDEVRDLLGSGFTTVAQVIEDADSESRGQEYGLSVSMAGILTQCRGKVTKKGSMMGFLVLEDLTGSIEGLVFPKVYEKYASMLSSDSLVVVDGKLSFREEEEPKLLVDAVRPLNAANAAIKAASPEKTVPPPGAGRTLPPVPFPPRSWRLSPTEALPAGAYPRPHGGDQVPLPVPPRPRARHCHAGSRNGRFAENTWRQRTEGLPWAGRNTQQRQRKRPLTARRLRQKR